MKRVAAATFLSLIALPIWAGIFADNFDDGDFNGWEIWDSGRPGSEWRVKDGVLTCWRMIARGSDLYFGEEGWRNYTIECDAKIVEALGAFYAIGFDLRLSDMDNVMDFSLVRCMAGFTVQEAYIWPWIHGLEVRGLGSKAWDLHLDRWYRLKGIANDDNFEFYIDGKLAASLSDSRFPTGRVAIFAIGCVAHFDNVIITGTDVPGNANIAAVSPLGKLASKWGQLKEL